MVCKNCGAQLSEDSRFCNICGNPLEANESIPEGETEALAYIQTSGRRKKRFILIGLIAVGIIIITAGILMFLL